MIVELFPLKPKSISIFSYFLIINLNTCIFGCIIWKVYRMIAKHYSCYSVTIKALLGMWGVCVYVYMLEYAALALVDLCEYTDACWGVYMYVEAKG